MATLGQNFLANLPHITSLYSLDFGKSGPLVHIFKMFGKEYFSFFSHTRSPLGSSGSAPSRFPPILR